MALIKNISSFLLFVLLNIFVYQVYAKCQFKEYPHSYNKAVANPNRGFYTTDITRLSDFRPLTKSHLQKLVDSGHTILYRAYCLDTLKTKTNISQDFLNKLQNDFAVAESTGTQLILRFYYSYTKDESDARLNIVLQHIKDLKNILVSNAKNIFALQVGYIGTYGEGYYTNSDFGDKGKINETQWKNRYEVIKTALLNTSPETTILVRTPEIKIKFLNSGVLSSSNLVDQKNRNRIGYYNDCFLSSEDDVGTFESTDEYNYVRKDTKVVPIVGETCRVYEPKTNCETALKEMEKMHITSLNSEYNESVLNSWKQNDCYERISDRLGYQLKLMNLITTTESGQNAMITFHAEVYNNGFSAPFDYKFARIILRNNKMECSKRVPIKATQWIAGEYFSICSYLKLPSNMKVGKYEYILEIADSASYTNNKRNLLFVNRLTQNTSTRLNHLDQYLEVTQSGSTSSYCSKSKITNSSCPSFSQNDLEAYPTKFVNELLSNEMKCTAL